MTDLTTGWRALRELGPMAVWHYARYRLGLVSRGIERRTPAGEWRDYDLAAILRPGVPSDEHGYGAYRRRPDGPRFFFDGVAPAPPGQAQASPSEPILEAEDVLAGRYRLFGGPPLELGYPPDWFAFPPPLDRLPRFDSLVHWSRIPLDLPGVDVRLVWELSRFGWVFPLARAYRSTREAKYAEACWRLIEAWREANPPYRGVHWASAQEAALRLLALAFAERAFLPAWAPHSERAATLARMVAVHARRIPPTLSYARAQANNHLLSEAAGLLTAGLLYPELEGSDRWRRIGRRLLQEALASQVFEDGGYVQHSTTYHRLALAVGVWCARLAEVNGDPLSPPASRGLERLTRGLAGQIGSGTGRTASFGPDDGSNILPLASVDSADARPVVAAAARLTRREAWYPDGPWDELSAWLGLSGGRRVDAPRPASLPVAGLHFLRGSETWGALRCARFRGRPGHSDQLHVDLWWRGLPLVFDPGTFLYNATAPFEHGLSHAAVHNTPLVDGLEPMRRAGRFRWSDWAQGEVERLGGEGVAALRGSHNGYRRVGVRLRRTLALVDSVAWVVEDEALGNGSHRMTAGWNLPDAMWMWGDQGLRVDSAVGVLVVEWSAVGVRPGLVRAGEWVAGQPSEGSVQEWGWRAPRYGSIEPCLRLVLTVSGRAPLRVRTRFILERSWPASMADLWDEPDALVARLRGSAGA